MMPAVKKRIVLCLDGTWNQVSDPRKVTNVVRLAQAVRPLAADGTPQVVYYNSGVGTGDALDKLLGGVVGRGLRANVKRAYAFLSLNYEPGDEIYVFGFSRGAYTARAVAGVVCASGILRKEHFDNFEVAWNFYRQPPTARRTGGTKAVAAYRQNERKLHTAARVRCVGVWDTVGSYGVPAGIGLGAFARYFTSWMRGFHDRQISDQVDIGLHAMALDECRRPFAPTFWTAPPAKPPKAHVEQVWFAGVHSNVGGGYEDARLADVALNWMIARVMALGREKFQSTLDFDTAFLKDRTTPSWQGTQYRSERRWPISRLFPYRRQVFGGPAAKTGEVPINERIHWSVQSRLEQPAAVDGAGERSYLPVNVRRPVDGALIASITPEEELLGS